MTEEVLSLKEEGNFHFERHEYAKAITKYESALERLKGNITGSTAALYLALLNNRLHASNKAPGNDNQALNDLFTFLKTKDPAYWGPVFGNRMMCKAFYRAHESYKSVGNVEGASFMLRACLAFEPENKAVLAAIADVEHMGLEQIAKCGGFEYGTAAKLFVEGLSVEGRTCVHCQEQQDSQESCLLLKCGHSFHRDCALAWMRAQAVNNRLVRHTLSTGCISLGDHTKFTCAICRAAVIG
jgi:tetratricopeptide (TPR) repeat protein